MYVCVCLLAPAFDVGLLLTSPQDMLSRTAQPSRELLAQRGLTMTNIHCPHPDPTDLPLPRLHTLDKYRLQAAKKSTDTGANAAGQRLYAPLTRVCYQSVRGFEQARARSDVHCARALDMDWIALHRWRLLTV